MLLDATTRKIQVLMDAAATTTESPVSVDYVDINATGAQAGASNTITNGTTAVDIVASPAAGYQRRVTEITVENADTANRTVTIRYNDTNGSVTRILVKMLLQPGQTLLYNTQVGWVIPATQASGGNKASFRAHKNGTDQSGISTGVVTKITFTTEVSDIGSYYDAPNSKWTPPAGPVLVGGQVFWSAGVVSGGLGTCRIYKNGSEFFSGFTTAQGAGDAIIPRSLIEDSANGTDYYEIYGDSNGAGSKTASGATQYTAFFGTSL